jgi:hypothetical protein
VSGFLRFLVASEADADVDDAGDDDEEDDEDELL